MSSVTVCVRFRPLSSREKKVHGDDVCISASDAESVSFKDEKEDLVFCFDRVFYQDAAQADVYEFLALPIVRDAVNAINGTIITYGQTGAGKTYSMEGPNILSCDEHQKGLLQRVVDGIFECTEYSMEMTKYNIKLSMVEIYLEKVRDLFDLSKDNLQIKEGKGQEIFLFGTTEISILDPAEALRCLSRGIANRAVGETQMNLSSSRSHCVYIFSIQRESAIDRKVKTGKLVLVDLAGSEKVEKTGAEGRVFEEAKTINKSLSALGNVISALTADRTNHIPYRDSKLTRILQDSLGGNSRTALLCCCSPSSSNALESLSTLRFGSRAKLIKTLPRASATENKCSVQHLATDSQDQSNWRNGIVDKEELLHLERIISDPESTEDLEAASEDVTSEIISSLQRAVEELRVEREELKRENETLESKKLAVANQLALHRVEALDVAVSFSMALSMLIILYTWVLMSSIAF